MLDMQDALLPPSLPPIAPRRPLCCSCSFGTPRPAPEFESRGERERLSAFSLSYVRPRVPAFHAPAPGRSGDAAGLRTNVYSTNTEHCTTAPSRPLASAYDPAAQQPAHGSTMQAGAVGGVGGLGGGWRCSCGPRYLACVPMLFVHRPVVVFPVCTARSHAALLHDAGGYRSHGSTRRKSTPVCVCRAVGSAAAVKSCHVTHLLRSSFHEVGRSAGRELNVHRRESALADARVITPKGLNLGAGLVPGGRGRAAAGESGARRRTSASQQRPYNCTAKAAEFPSSL